MKASFLIAVLFAACAAQTQTLHVVPAHLEGTGQTTNSVQFFCTQDYNRDECSQHALALRGALRAYPLERLGMWSFILVPSYKWKDLVHALGGSSHSPAFTIFDQRTTVMESSLFSATATRYCDDIPLGCRSRQDQFLQGTRTSLLEIQDSFCRVWPCWRSHSGCSASIFSTMGFGLTRWRL